MLPSIQKLLIGFAALGLSVVSGQEKDIVGTALGDTEGRFTTLAALLNDANLVDTLQDTMTEFTVFAPTNDAFGKLSECTLTALGNDVGALTNVLTYHVKAEAEIFSADITDKLTEVVMLNEEPITIESIWHLKWHGWWSWSWVKALFVNDYAKVIVVDIDASNGVIHAIDSVLVPPSLELPKDLVEVAAEAGLTTLVTALQLAGLDTNTVLRSCETDAVADEFTVFAPTNEAFAKVPLEILAYLLRNPEDLAKVLLRHVVIGDTITSSAIIRSVSESSGPITVTDANQEEIFVDFVNGSVVLNTNEATVTNADVIAANGIAHVIDTVLIPESLNLPSTIAALAAETPDLSTLAGMIDRVNLFDKVSGPAPFTVFAPSNDAFAEIDATQLSDDELTDILMYHVVVGDVRAATLIDHAPLDLHTLNFASIGVSFDGTNVLLEDDTTETAMVVSPDNKALDGVVHIIDKVLIPPAGCPHDNQWLCWLLGW